MRRLLAGLTGAGLALTGLAPCTPVAHAAPHSTASSDLTRYVDPFIGTANGGNTWPGAVRPFGMLAFSPTSTTGDQTNTGAAGGYQYDTTRIRGFALTHVNGAGCHPGAMGDVPIMPVSQAVTSSPTADTKDEVYASNFSHADEKATPGRYTLKLANGTTTDFAATTRAGIGSFTFPSDKPANLLFRTSNSLNGSEDADITISPAQRTVTGSVLTGAFCGRRGNGGGSNKRSYYRLYFTASFDKAFTQNGTWHDSELTPGGTTASGGEGYETGAKRAGKGSGGWVGFDPKQGPVHMRVGISYTSLAAARANLATEVERRDDVDSLARQGRRAWDRQLHRIEVRGGDQAHLTKFYTALYHAFLEPNVLNDVAGTYWGADQRVHQLARGQHAQYGNYSGWDEYRAHTQLLALLEPRIAGDMAQSMYNDALAHDGIWDRWLHLTAWTHVMTGDPSAPTLAGFYSLGVRNFDVQGAYDSLYKQATVQNADDVSSYGCPGQCAGIRPDLADYMRLHYVPQDGGHTWGGAAETLEDSVADYSLADWGGRLGRTRQAAVMTPRAGYWKNTFNPDATPELGYQQARNRDGWWVTPFSPASDLGFAQGTSSTYTWMVPHDVSGLAALMGGRQEAAARLDDFFQRDGQWVFSGDPLRYDATNEPGIHIPWMYNALGKPWKTQQTVRAIEDLAYTTGPKGLPGNDDLGTMSAWYLFAAMGFYPQNPARAEMLLSSPVFPHVVVHRGNGVDIRLDAPQASQQDIYITGVRLDGRTWTKSWLPERVMNRGGRIQFDLADAPDMVWATRQRDLPVDRHK